MIFLRLSDNNKNTNENRKLSTVRSLTRLIQSNGFDFISDHLVPLSLFRPLELHHQKQKHNKDYLISSKTYK
jgi:hypothetical protein